MSPCVHHIGLMPQPSLHCYLMVCYWFCQWSIFFCSSSIASPEVKVLGCFFFWFDLFLLSFTRQCAIIIFQKPTVMIPVVILSIIFLLVYKHVCKTGCTAPHPASHSPNFWSVPQCIPTGSYGSPNGWCNIVWESKHAVRTESTLSILLLSQMVKILLQIIWQWGKTASIKIGIPKSTYCIKYFKNFLEFTV